MKDAYLSALGQILARKADCLATCRAKLAELDNLTELKETRRKAEETLQSQLTEIQDFVHENARKSQDQNKYRTKYNKLASVIDEQKQYIADLKNQELNAIANRERLRRFIRAIESCTEATSFIPEIWSNTVERAIVYAEGLIRFEFKNGESIEIKLKTK